jgi:lipoprotein-releasing system ATP-binding protein
MTNSETILRAVHINKSFSDPVHVQVLQDINMSVSRGEFVSITGKSGCGKSTLLYILSTLDTDFTGDLFIDCQPMRGLSEKQLAKVRNEKIGFVFQFHYLLNEFSVLENVMLPALKLNLHTEEEIREHALRKLEILGIKSLADKKANKISGGEKQRVAIARALINNPSIIMCDEPTGNLDKTNSLLVFELFKEITENEGLTLMVVTHDQEFANRTHRIIEMEDGKILL